MSVGATEAKRNGDYGCINAINDFYARLKHCHVGDYLVANQLGAWGMVGGKFIDTRRWKTDECSHLCLTKDEICNGSYKEVLSNGDHKVAKREEDSVVIKECRFSEVCGGDCGDTAPTPTPTPVPTPAPTPTPTPKPKDPTEPSAAAKAWGELAEFKFNDDGWQSKDGKGFNWTRFGIDAAGAAALATGAGILTNTLIKKSQLKSGYQNIRCVSWGAAAGFGEVFIVR